MYYMHSTNYLNNIARAHPVLWSRPAQREREGEREGERYWNSAGVGYMPAV